MAGEPQVETRTMPEDTLRDIQKLLREPGETPQRSGGEGAAPTQRFCGACWAALPADAVDCPSCGRSLAELEAARQAKAAADQAWVPPSRAEAVPTAPAVTSPAAADYGLSQAPAAAVPEPLAQELRKSRHHFLMAVAIGSAWGGAVMVAAWFTIQNISPKNNGASSNAPINAAAVLNGPAVIPANVPDTSPPVSVQTNVLSRVVWRNPYPELRVELFLDKTSKAQQPNEARISPGTYEVRIYPKSGNKPVVKAEKPITAADGNQVEVAVSPADAARFFVELGGRFNKLDKVQDAIGAWERALEVDPNCVPAHLCLGTALPLEHRYQDARDHLDAVLARDPANRYALDGKKLATDLENAEKNR